VRLPSGMQCWRYDTQQIALDAQIGQLCLSIYLHQNRHRLVRGERRHHVVGMVDPLPPLIREGGEQGRGNFVRRGRAEERRIGHGGM
jgi:hypothetical protein